MTTVHHSPPPGATPFAIYEDPEDHDPPSPSDVYEGDVSFQSDMSMPGADDAMPSIEQGNHHQLEQQDPEQDSLLFHRYSSSYTSRPSISSNTQSSRRTSGITSTSYISSLPSEFSVASKPVAPPANNLDSRYTPRRERPPFRNPSSVRAMQMSSPPPLPAAEASRERLKGQYKLTTPARSGRSDSMSTASSRRPRSHRESFAVESARHTPTPQQLPLVLLHVTILPMQMPYSHEIMKKVMPEWLVENYRILEEKLQDIILMRRGLLIPHPRDEYEVLEERILESLELKIPRLLKCGHFVAPEEDSTDEKDEDEESAVDGSLGRRSSMSGGTITVDEEGDWRYQTSEADDESTCLDCHRPVKKPGRGVGAGTKRWDLKIYAANGLMRAGAWLAAWSEMESCDVEIAPWIPEDVRKALEKRLLEEQEAARNKQLYAAELQRRIEQEAAAQKQAERKMDIKRRAEEIEVQRRIEAEAAELHRKLEQEAAEKKRLEDAVYEKIEEAKETMRLEFEAQAMAEANAVAERLRAMEDALKQAQDKKIAQPSSPPDDSPVPQYREHNLPPRKIEQQVPLGTLLKNSILLLIRDSSNVLLVALTALVVYLAMTMDPSKPLSWYLTTFADRSDAPQVIITTTAISVETLTVTQLPTLSSSLSTVAPAAETSLSSLVEEMLVESETSSTSLPNDPATPLSSISTRAASSQTPDADSSSEHEPEPTPSVHPQEDIEQSTSISHTPSFSSSSAATATLSNPDVIPAEEDDSSSTTEVEAETETLRSQPSPSSLQPSVDAAAPSILASEPELKTLIQEPMIEEEQDVITSRDEDTNELDNVMDAPTALPSEPLSNPESNSESKVEGNMDDDVHVELDKEREVETEMELSSPPSPLSSSEINDRNEPNDDDDDDENSQSSIEENGVVLQQKQEQGEGEKESLDPVPVA
ncbi:unnamed protein product [Periconia digitata]|uniref:Pathway-specific nitrogen regulator n=1 Tax=Periconia digitata TaxID=1303443 RepID=A0A9W4UHZ3_9PLEO|nr:unnamed protein product [Periconia digitata]